MNIVVLVKQVPDTTEMSIDKETGTLIRTGVPTITNPDDLAGIEEALKIKDQIGAKVTAITMGPTQSEEMLRELLARGVDEVILLTDKRFAGSDTWATSNVLSKAISKLEYDLIISGRQAIDGDTAQVGPQVAEKLGIPQITYVNEIKEINENKIIVKKALENHDEIIEAQLPCLITTLSGMNKPRYMTCNGIWECFDKEIIKWGQDDLGIEEDKVGLKSSPTKVRKTFTKEVLTQGNIYEGTNQEAVQLVLNYLQKEKFIS
ncbi:MAG TPA: electron transfer flavoprotein subunit beta/FixA family protein [Haloplasmataceae bacterium]